MALLAIAYGIGAVGAAINPSLGIFGQFRG